MLTSAVFLRAASVGIPTAQPLKTGLGRSFTAIARCNSLFQNKGKSSLTFADRIQQEKSHTPTISPSPKTFARPFHASAVRRLKCIWPGPCLCFKCQEAARKPICEVCKVNPTEHTIPILIPRRELRKLPKIKGHKWKSFCKECGAKAHEED